MEYIAQLEKVGRQVAITFPDGPGCQTFADLGEGESVDAVAAEALEGWLVVHLENGDAPPRPKARRRAGGRAIAVRVPPPLAVALQIRWRRHELGLSQSELGKLLRVSRQQIALLEDPEANVTLGTLGRAAKALELDLDVALSPRGVKQSGRPRARAVQHA